MKGLLVSAALFVTFRGVVAGQAQPALVTFYSAGCRFCVKELMADEFAGSAIVPYGGAVYDGQVKVLQAMAPNRFVTVRMSPGPHSFAGENMGYFSLTRKRAKKGSLSLTLQPGQHYFVSLLTKDKGVTFWFRRFTTILAEKDCQEAFKEGAQTEPLRPRGIRKDHLADVQATVYFPACEAGAMSSH